MDTSWKEQIKAYLAAVNQAYVNGKDELVAPFFPAGAACQSERERLQRAKEQNRARGVHALAAKTHAVPLQIMQIGGNRVEALLRVHHQLHYMQQDRVFLQELSHVQLVKLMRDGEHWAFLDTWGEYFPEEQAEDHYEDEPEGGQEDMGTGAHEGEAEGAEPDSDAASGPVEVAYAAEGYDREQAVAYAETYWDSYNPAFKVFVDDDCTNFISQCLYAGGIPMVYGGRSQGWWYRGGSSPDWSYSWTVAHSLYWQLKSGKAPFYAKVLSDPAELELGDVISYDFEGDGRWDHSAIVTGKDSLGQPLVNAHTNSSRMRYWEYRDSPDYTSNIRYSFFHIYGQA
ncbi:amidase domain-containing protein [Brevibacillus sp. B_LB10_24]|uniref:amidase domain-containing protein n=1 Tax=Brevibacillus sp. B_LB10_24 TaxID=3380645 RepID=UPI0038B7B654